MNNDVYEKLAEALDRVPGAFPRTESGVELKILRKIFTPEEARIASNLTRDGELVDTIAGRAGTPPDETEAILKGMVRSGNIWSSKKDGVRNYRLAPFIVGIWEEQWEVMDAELAHLCEHYFNEGGLAGIMRPQPAMNRVVPAQSAIKSEIIMPYDYERYGLW